MTTQGTLVALAVAASIWALILSDRLSKIQHLLEKIHDELAIANNPVRYVRYDTTSKQASTQTGGVGGKDA